MGPELDIEAETPPTRSPVAAAGEVRVLALIDHLVLGGAEMLLSRFASRCADTGIDLSVACLTELDGNPAAEPLRAAGVDPTDLQLPGRPTLHALRTVRRHIAATRPDVVHTHLGDSDLLGGLASRSLGIPVVSTFHTMMWDRTLQTRARRTIIRHCMARIVAVSDSAARDYAARGWARPGQLVTIPNGVDVTPAPGEGAAVRRELGWREDDLVLGMLSALRPEKAHDVAIDAFARLRASMPNLRLLIVGDGRDAERIATLVGPLGTSAQMVGRRADIMRYLDAFDVCLHPSRADAFPTTLIEALAASVPILATDVGGIPEIVDAASAVLIPAPPRPDAIAAALATLLSDPTRRRKMGAAGQKRYLTRFTAAPWVQRTRELYDTVLAEGPRRRVER